MKKFVVIIFFLLFTVSVFADDTQLTYHQFSLSWAVSPSGIVMVCDGDYHTVTIPIPHGIKIIETEIDGGTNATSGDFYIRTPPTAQDPTGVRLCDVHVLQNQVSWNVGDIRCDRSTWPLYRQSPTDTLLFGGLCAANDPGKPPTMAYFNSDISYQ